MGILSVFRRLRRKGEPAREEAKHAAVQEPARRQESAGAEKGASPTFTGLATHSVILRPIITEKAAVLAADGRYAFQVIPEATKTDIRRAVEHLFRVHVTDVKLISLPAKTRRRGAIVGSVPGTRKAIVTLKDGERIDLSAAVPFERGHVDHAHTHA